MYTLHTLQQKTTPPPHPQQILLQNPRLSIAISAISRFEWETNTKDKINKNLKCQKFSTMKLEDAKDIVLKAKFKTCPVKVLMNVGINNLDSDTSKEIINKYEDCIEVHKSKIPNVAINYIEIHSETWSNCKNCKNIIIEDYELLKIIDPLKKGSNKGRKSGGMHIYCKSHIKPYLKIIKTSNSYRWLEIDKKLG